MHFGVLVLYLGEIDLRCLFSVAATAVAAAAALLTVPHGNIKSFARQDKNNTMCGGGVYSCVCVCVCVFFCVRVCALFMCVRVRCI